MSSPFIIGITGAVSVGKSYFANQIKNIFSLAHKNVQIVSLDSFLFPNNVLNKMDLLDKKGFSKTYNSKLIKQFITDVKAQKNNIKIPKYSHLTYDILENDFEQIDVSNSLDILIIEGITALQKYNNNFSLLPYYDLKIFITADVNDIKKWFFKKVLLLKNDKNKPKNSFYTQYENMSDKEFLEFANDVYEKINFINYKENILPTKKYADLIIKKDSEHGISFIK